MPDRLLINWVKRKMPVSFIGLADIDISTFRDSRKVEVPLRLLNGFYDSNVWNSWNVWNHWNWLVAVYDLEPPDPVKSEAVERLELSK